MRFSPKDWGVPFDPCLTKISLEQKERKKDKERRKKAQARHENKQLSSVYSGG